LTSKRMSKLFLHAVAESMTDMHLDIGALVLGADLLEHDQSELRVVRTEVPHSCVLDALGAAADVDLGVEHPLTFLRRAGASVASKDGIQEFQDILRILVRDFTHVQGAVIVARIHSRNDEGRGDADVSMRLVRAEVLPLLLVVLILAQGEQRRKLVADLWRRHRFPLVELIELVGPKLDSGRACGRGHMRLHRRDGRGPVGIVDEFRAIGTIWIAADHGEVESRIADVDEGVAEISPLIRANEVDLGVTLEALAKNFGHRLRLLDGIAEQVLDLVMVSDPSVQVQSRVVLDVAVANTAVAIAVAIAEPRLGLDRLGLLD